MKVCQQQKDTSKENVYGRPGHTIVYYIKSVQTRWPASNGNASVSHNRVANKHSLAKTSKSFMRTKKDLKRRKTQNTFKRCQRLLIAYYVPVISASD